MTRYKATLSGDLKEKLSLRVPTLRFAAATVTVAALTVAAFGDANAHAQQTVLSFTGANQSYIVPTGVSSISVKL